MTTDCSLKSKKGRRNLITSVKGTSSPESFSSLHLKKATNSLFRFPDQSIPLHTTVGNGIRKEWQRKVLRKIEWGEDAIAEDYYWRLMFFFLSHSISVTGKKFYFDSFSLPLEQENQRWIWVQLSLWWKKKKEDVWWSWIQLGTKTCFDKRRK